MKFYCFFVDVVEISSDEDSDEPQVIGERKATDVSARKRSKDDVSKEEDDDEGKDPENSGTHTNDAMNRPDEEGRVLVNVGHPPKEDDIFLAPQLSANVKPHQVGCDV